MVMLVLVQSAVRVENVVQHRGIRWHGSLRRRGRFGGNRVRRQRQFCNRIFTEKCQLFFNLPLKTSRPECRQGEREPDCTALFYIFRYNCIAPVRMQRANRHKLITGSRTMY